MAMLPSHVEDFTHDHIEHTFIELCLQRKSEHSQVRYVIRGDI